MDDKKVIKEVVIEALEQVIPQLVDAIDKRVDAKFEAFDKRVDAKFEAFDKKVDAKFETFEDKVRHIVREELDNSSFSVDRPFKLTRVS